ALLIYVFFQAEDGIRDRNVTGVQTCALPISDDLSVVSEESDGARLDQNLRTGLRGLLREIPVEQVALKDVTAFVPRASLIDDERSEERRVGKESRAVWSR